MTLLQHGDISDAVVAQLAEHQLPKLRVAGSNPVYRSHINNTFQPTINNTAPDTGAVFYFSPLIPIFMSAQWPIPRSKTTVLFTIGYLIVLALIWGLFFRSSDSGGRLLCYILVGVLAVIFLIAFFLSPRRLVLADGVLTIERTVGSRRLPLDDIAEVRRVYIPIGGNVRICGVGGLFGNVGWYYTRDTGRYFAYMGSLSGTVLITMKSGRKYMVNCFDPESLILTLRECQDSTRNKCRSL